MLVGNNLSVGSSNLSTTFSGVIQGGFGSTGSSLTKIGTGTLTLASVNSYTKSTIVNSGRLNGSHDGALGNSDVSVASGAILSLQGGATNNYIFDQGALNVVTGAAVNLNYDGNPDVVGFLIVNGISQPAGLYGGAASGAPNQFPQFTGVGRILVTTPNANSRKTQGGASFDINLPFTGPNGIECRNAGTNNTYEIVTTFGFPITFNSASVTSGSANIANITGNGTTTITVDLTDVANAQNLAVTLFGVNYGMATGDVILRMSVLIGDTTGNGIVNASDVSQTKSKSGQPINISNFRADVTGNGSVNASDVSLVKSKSGTALPSAVIQPAKMTKGSTR